MISSPTWSQQPEWEGVGGFWGMKAAALFYLGASALFKWQIKTFSLICWLHVSSRRNVINDDNLAPHFFVLLDIQTLFFLMSSVSVIKPHERNIK